VPHKSNDGWPGPSDFTSVGLTGQETFSLYADVAAREAPGAEPTNPTPGGDFPDREAFAFHMAQSLPL